VLRISLHLPERHSRQSLERSPRPLSQPFCDAKGFTALLLRPVEDLFYPILLGANKRIPLFR